MKHRLSVFALLTVMLLATACGSAEKRDDRLDGAGGAGAQVTAVVVDGVTGTNVDPDSIAGRAPKQRTIYFDFATSDIRSEYIAIVAEHGRYLAQNPEGRVRLEGHTDERGTREYNIALGEDRSKAVSRMLQLQGVSSAQLRNVSYGEELPVDEGHSEAAWQKNRRVNIVYEVE